MPKARDAFMANGDIRVRPDKGKEYAQLIETKGLPLFRGPAAGWSAGGQL